MNDYFLAVKGFLLELDYNITYESEEDGVLVITHEDDGINNLVVGVADPILILEQFLFEIHNESTEVYKSLLMKNRDIISGAFALDETGKKVIFRDTLALENLDQNEVENTINSLSLLINEFSDEIIKFSKK